MTKVTHLTLDTEGGLDRRRIHLREISGDSDAPLETVGQDLRTARLRRGDDLASVSRALKIRKDHLEALEEDHLDVLPGKTYAVGFVRTYSAYLGLDSAECVERFKAEISGRPDETRMAPAILDRDDQRKLPQGWRIIAGFVIVMVGYGIYHLWSSSNRPVIAPVPLPPARLASNPAPAQAQSVPAAAPPAETSAQTQAQTPPGARLAPPPSAATATQATAAGPAVPEQAVPANGHVYGLQNHDARVILRARAATHVLVRGPDGMIYCNETLNPGDSYRVPNLVGLTMATTNAGAVEVDLDGLAMGMAGHDLQTMGGLSLDPQAIVDRYNNGGPG